jgi:eukaryotic translation initiation factor 2-alpha kinase 4
MAWKATGAWGKPSSNNDSSFPGLNATQAPTTTQYEELQQNELIALEAIYREDFKRIDGGRSAWKVGGLPSCLVVLSDWTLIPWLESRAFV